MWVGKYALIVLIILGAITGLVLYPIFHSITPIPGVMSSPYRLNLTPQDIAYENPPASVSKSTGVSGGPMGASVIIPGGASVQGNPSYVPDTVTVKKGDLVTIINKDTAPHTLTNGKDASDPTSGKLFDTSIINPGSSAQFGTAKLAPGTYPFNCSIHPYMTGSLKVQ
jgi:plastocyanin